ncbi:hypothetical protein ACFLSU_04630 [Bacteroidota bacterium]
MLSVVGKVLKKISNSKNAELIIDEQNGNKLSFQVRSKETILKLVSVDTGNMIRVGYESDLSELKSGNTTSRINNLIAKEITPLGM